jgi:hypothetical protein
MNLELSDGTMEMFSGVILHEFGHARLTPSHAKIAFLYLDLGIIKKT